MTPNKRHVAILPRDLSELCIYCGQVATVRDHYCSWGLTALPYWLPACRECNGLLSYRLDRFLHERVGFLKQKLEKRYDQILKADYHRVSPGLTGRLKQRFIQEQALAKIINCRINWAVVIEGLAFALETLHEQAEELADILRDLESWRDNLEPGILRRAQKAARVVYRVP